MCNREPVFFFSQPLHCVPLLRDRFCKSRTGGGGKGEKGAREKGLRVRVLDWNTSLKAIDWYLVPADIAVGRTPCLRVRQSRGRDIDGRPRRPRVSATRPGPRGSTRLGRSGCSDWEAKGEPVRNNSVGNLYVAGLRRVARLSPRIP